MMEQKSLQILLADDEEIIHQSIGKHFEKLGYRLDHVYNGKTAMEAIQKQEFDLALVDIRMPHIDGITLLKKMQTTNPLLPVVIITGHGTMETAISALREGATDFLTKPIKLLELEAVVEKCRKMRSLLLKKHHLSETIGAIQSIQAFRSGKHGLIGISPEIEHIRTQILKAVKADCDTILITGETGTGKEVVASEIHHNAGGKTQPFIAVNCPAIPDSLIESELFGHVKGAFTGATHNKAGYFGLADQGTLFLDEVAELSRSAQATLLRALETRSFRQVGGSREFHAKIRLIAASNAPLEHYVETGAFRQDLYFRLNIFPIHIPPLRDRRFDILPLAEFFLSLYNLTKNRKILGFSNEAKDVLLNYHFPGNVRELRNMVERAIIIKDSGMILMEDLIPPKPSIENKHIETVKSPDNDQQLIREMLEKTKWNRKEAARRLKMPYSTLMYKIKTYHIE